MVFINISANDNFPGAHIQESTNFIPIYQRALSTVLLEQRKVFTFTKKCTNNPVDAIF